MVETLRHLLDVLSPRLRRGFKFCMVHTIVSSLIDALAFVSLYPLLTEVVSSSSKTTFVSHAILDIFGSQPKTTVEVYLAAITFSLFILSSLVGILLVRRQCRMVAAVEQDVSSRLFQEYMHSPYLDHVTRNSSVMVRNTTFLSNDLAGNVMMSYFVLFQCFFSIAFLIVLLALVNPLVIACAVVYFGLGVYLYARYVMPRARSAGRQGMELWRHILQSMQEGFGGVKALQASNSVDVVGRDHARRRREFAGYRYRMAVYSQMPSYYLQAVMIGGVVLFISIVILLHTSNIAPLIGIIIASFLRLLPSLYQGLSSLGRIRSSHANIETIYSELARMEGDPLQRSSRVTDIKPVHGSNSVDSLMSRDTSSPSVSRLSWRRSVRFDHVTFRYPGSEIAALDDVSFEIPKGSFVGIVGPSGAGKTTIVDMMLGLFGAASGSIKVDETVLDGATVIEAWRQCVGYVPQDVFLLDSTVRDNIVFGRQGAGGDAEVWSALASAQIADVVERMPLKLDTVLGEHGVRVSGGQRQRFGIARALFREPDILILDEATSALDTATEAALAVTVRNLEVVNLTRIAVAHRLSTVRECDTLFLFDGGRMVGEGDFVSLRQHNPMFDELARLARID